jgi:hypothetical protein
MNPNVFVKLHESNLIYLKKDFIPCDTTKKKEFFNFKIIKLIWNNCKNYWFILEDGIVT